jgi:hypothetical protein
MLHQDSILGSSIFTCNVCGLLLCSSTAFYEAHVSKSVDPTLKSTMRLVHEKFESCRRRFVGIQYYVSTGTRSKVRYSRKCNVLLVVAVLVTLVTGRTAMGLGHISGDELRTYGVVPVPYFYINIPSSVFFHCPFSFSFGRSL